MKTKKTLNSYYISEKVKWMLEKAKEQVTQKDFDRVYIIDGEEGSGKSLLGLQLGYYLDPTLNLDRITFTGNQFADAIKKANKHQCIIFDEAFNGLESGGAPTKLNKLIIRSLMECRQKNLFIIIILPTIFLLQKYAAIFRSRCLFHVFISNNGNRGYYRVYNRANKKMLYILGKKMYSYSKPYIRNTHVFRGKYPINEEDYRKKKLKALEEEEEQKKLDRFAIRFALLLKRNKELHNEAYSEQIKYLDPYKEGIKRSAVSRLIAQIPQKLTN